MRHLREGTEQPLHVTGKPTEVAGYETLVIAETKGRAIALGDVARVVDVEEQRTLALVDGKPAVALNVIKRSGANTVGVMDAVRKEVSAWRSPRAPRSRSSATVRSRSGNPCATFKRLF